MSKSNSFIDSAAKYNRLKLEILPNVSPQVAISTKNEMRSIRDSLWATFASVPDNTRIVFNNPQELTNVINILLDTGKIFGIDWKRKTTSSSDPTKIAGSIDTLRVKKVNGYVKGTEGGKKALGDTLNDRVTLWVATGELYNEGYGNWRSIYVKDVKAIRLNGIKIVVDIVS